MLRNYLRGVGLSVPAALFYSLAGMTQSYAMEGNGSTYAMGVEQHMMGAFPPKPGFYSLNYAQHYSANRLRNNNGSKAVDDFDLEVDVIASRLAYISDKTLLGGRLGAHVLVPFVDMDVRVNGRTDSDKGMGDIVMAPMLGYDFSPEFHAILALDIVVPTGRYDSKKLANIGRNYWAIEPLAVFTYVQPNGFNGDIKIMYDFNFENSETDYKSGQEFHFDYDAGWGFANRWVAGVGGYAYWQVTDDRIHGERVHNNKSKALGIGPSLKYTGDGWFASVKWQKDFQVRNRPDGEALWLKATFPLPL